MDTQNKKKFLLELLYFVSIGGIIYLSTRLLIGYMMPFLIAVIVSAAVQKPATKISEKIKVKKGIVAALLSVLIFVLAGVSVIFIVYFSGVSIKGFMGDFPQFLKDTAAVLTDIKNNILHRIKEYSPEIYSFLNDAFSQSLQSLFTKITDLFSNFAASAAKKLPSFLFACLAAVVAGCYISKDFDGLKKFFSLICGEKIYGNIIKIKNILTGSVLKILRGYLILMLITFLQLLVGFWLIGIKHIFILSALVAFIDLLPVFGTGTVLLPWGIFEIFTNSGAKGAGILLLYAVVTLVRNFAEPKIIGGQIGINPLFMLISLFLGLRLFGAFGLIVFPITLVTVIKFYKQDMA